ncbi:hypothetical protein RR46_07480 [Papilio xuthus]|uniref:Uncharacterized protein n=1 Tax=Papilio xuthus TaxID=66420 RepID=A0A194QB41_PAPXU|nr:hypothetical protein RR46_07480 [Papilio xuthus]
MNPHCTRKVIGGELQERLIPVPYSKTSTDQAVVVRLGPACFRASEFVVGCCFVSQRASVADRRSECSHRARSQTDESGPTPTGRGRHRIV